MGHSIEKRIDDLEQEIHRSVWPLEEQMICALDIVKRRTWSRVWPPNADPIRYVVDRDFPGPISSPYPATDREIRLLAAMCRYAEEHEADSSSSSAVGDAMEYVRAYLAEEKDIAECLDDLSEYTSKLVTRMDLGKQPHREQQLYALWRELNEP